MKEDSTNIIEKLAKYEEEIEKSIIEFMSDLIKKDDTHGLKKDIAGSIMFRLSLGLLKNALKESNDMSNIMEVEENIMNKVKDVFDEVLEEKIKVLKNE